MHEMSLCRNLLDKALILAREYNARSIKSINVTIGPLCTIDALHLQETFTQASAGTMADNARLVIDKVPMTIRCLDCLSESQVIHDLMTCHHCGSQHTQLINGTDVMLHDIEIIT